MQKERDRYSRTAKRGQGVIDWASKRNQSCEWKAQGWKNIKERSESNTR